MSEAVDPWSHPAVLERLRASGAASLERIAARYLVKASGTEHSADAGGFRTEIADAESYVPAWVIRPLCKRAGNPFPDRISVGRAPNCDVVLRFRFMSKLHAHIHTDKNEIALSDNASVNGTWVNDVAIPPGERVLLKDRDIVRFGQLALVLMSAQSLVKLLEPRLV